MLPCITLNKRKKLLTTKLKYMTSVLIIDDETRARAVLRHYLQTMITGVDEIREADSVATAISMINEYKPDLVFLDVEMPHQNGFDFLTQLVNPSFDVIFTTAYNQYAIQAIRFSALDYLLKPVDPDELQQAVQRHHDKKADANQNKALYDNLISNIRKQDVKDFTISVPSSDGIHLFKVDEIMRLEADKSYTHIHLVNGKPFIASKTLKHFEDMLQDFNFIRTHKSHLINPKFVSRISNANDFLVMSNGEKVEVSRRKKDEVQALLTK